MGHQRTYAVQKRTLPDHRRVQFVGVSESDLSALPHKVGARALPTRRQFGTHMFLFGGLGVSMDENRENEMWRTDDGIHWRLRHHNTIPVP